MRYHLALITTATAAAMFANSANADFDFEDIDLQDAPYSEIEEYNDLYFQNMKVMNIPTWTSSNSTGYDNGYALSVMSGEQVAYNRGGNDLSISGESFSLSGGWFTAAWRDGLQLRVVGQRDGVDIYNSTHTLSAFESSWIQLGMYDVDSVTFTSWGGDNVWTGGDGSHFAMDNLAIQVPAPGAMALLGVAGVAARRRRRG